MGLTLPGTTVVCGDSHTSTHGAFGAFAFGIGTSEVAHVLATQCLLQRRPRTLQVRIEGQLGPGVSAKDLILAVIARIGIAGGTGQVIEYTGSTVRALSMEERMTVCNMSIEAGARAGLIAPDDTTFRYLEGRPRAPKGAEWDRSVAGWRTLQTDAGARYDRTVEIDAGSLEPTITFGTNPSMSAPIGGAVPDPGSVTDAADRAALERALRYMGLRPGQRLLGHPVDVVFIGSCTKRADRGSARRRLRPSRAPGGQGRPGPGGARLPPGEAGRRGGGARPRVPGGGRGMARAGLLDVHRHERRFGSARASRR